MRWNRKRKRMNARGMLISLSAGIVLIAIVAGHRYLAPIPRVNTALFATSQTAALARVDFEKLGELAGVFDALPWTQRIVCDMLMPYEGVLVLDVDETRKARQVLGAVSARCFGSLILSCFGKSANVPTLGAFQWTTPGIIPEEGAWVLRGEETIAQDVLDTMRERWPVTGAAEPMTLEGGHLLEAYVDNQCGQGFLALAEISAESMRAAGNNQTVSDGSPPPKQELQRIFDAKELSGLLYRARMARLTADSQGPDHLQIQVCLECPDPTAAQSAEFALMTMRDLAFRQLLETGVVLEGDTSLDGTRVAAELTLSGLSNACRELGNQAPQSQASPAMPDHVENQSKAEGKVR